MKPISLATLVLGRPAAAWPDGPGAPPRARCPGPAPFQQSDDRSLEVIMRKLSLAVPILLALSAVGAAGARAEPAAGPAVLTPAELDADTGGQSLLADNAADFALDLPAATGLVPNFAVVTSTQLAIALGVEVNPPPIELNLAPVDPAF